MKTATDAADRIVVPKPLRQALGLRARQPVEILVRGQEAKAAMTRLVSATFNVSPITVRQTPGR